LETLRPILMVFTRSGITPRLPDLDEIWTTLSTLTGL